MFVCNCVRALVPAMAAESCAATPSSLSRDLLVNPYACTQVCVLVLCMRIIMGVNVAASHLFTHTHTHKPILGRMRRRGA